MSRDLRLVESVKKELSPVVFELFNESHMHSGDSKESHYRLLIVSDQFKSLNRVERQQKVYSLFKEEFELGLHALSLRLKTEDEWQKTQTQNFASPECAHKPKAKDF